MDDFESCSWCLCVVRWADLWELSDGANVCPECVAEAGGVAGAERLIREGGV